MCGKSQVLRSSSESATRLNFLWLSACHRLGASNYLWNERIYQIIHFLFLHSSKINMCIWTNCFFFLLLKIIFNKILSKYNTSFILRYNPQVNHNQISAWSDLRSLSPTLTPRKTTVVALIYYSFFLFPTATSSYILMVLFSQPDKHTNNLPQSKNFK